jgi:tRNA threonylcarbamoyladenosine biosynthesis protein TsaB
MAEGTDANDVVCCLDARMHEVYFAAYTRLDRSWRTVHEPSVRAPDALPDLPGSRWLGCGSGFAAYGEILAARYKGQLVATEPTRYPRARDIAALAAPAFAAGEARSAEYALPLYIRDKVALRIDERPNR